MVYELIPKVNVHECRYQASVLVMLLLNASVSWMSMSSGHSLTSLGFQLKRVV